MKYRIFAYLICTGALITGIPALTAQTPAPAPAVKTMDTKAYSKKLQATDLAVRGKPAEAFAAWMQFIETENLNGTQLRTILNRAVQVVFQIKDAEAAKAAYSRLIALIRASEDVFVQTSFVTQAYRVPKDIYRADVLDAVKKIVNSGKEDQIAGLIRNFAGNAAYFELADELYGKIKLEAPGPFGIATARLALGHLKFKGDAETAKKYFMLLADRTAKIKAERDSAIAELEKAGKKANRNPDRPWNEILSTFHAILPELLTVNRELTAEIFARFKPLMQTENALIFELGNMGMYAKRAGDHAAYDAAVKKALTLPYGITRTKIVTILADVADNDTANMLYTAELENPALTPQEHFNYVNNLRRRCGNVQWFQRGFNENGAYERWRKFTGELIRINDAADGRKPANSVFYRENAYTAFGYGDFDFAVKQIAIAENMTEPAQIKNLLDTAVMIRLWQKDANAVSKLIERNNQPADDLYWRVVDFFSKNGKMTDFDRTFAADKLNSEAKLRVIRRASELFYRAKRYEVCRDIYNDILQNQFISLEPKKYKATFMDDPPRTADGFMRMEISQNWDGMETRFIPYGENPNVNTKIDVERFLKDTEKPQTDPQWKTGVYCAYDLNGLHIYIRGVDPGIEEVMQGKRDAGVLEFTFRPHDDAPYHMLFFENLPFAVDNINLEYASPTPRYRNTQDTFITDSAPAKDGFAAHVYIPWITFYENLPLNGKCWYLGLQRWCKGGGQTLSGQAHELARMLNIQFDITKEQERAIKYNLCRSAFNRFKNSQTLPVWKNDDKLGDPEFYEKELAPLAAELEEAGKLLDDKNADINAIFEKYMAAWAEFEFTIAEKRRKYLRKNFFNNTVGTK